MFKPFFGKEFEISFAKSIHNKRFSQLPYNLQRFVLYVFNKKYILRRYKCTVIDGSCKPDVILKLGKETKYISLKAHNAEFIHTEDVKAFTIFLRKNGISEETIETIKLFHYGDGTTDGTGERRLTGQQAYRWLAPRIEKANKELNSSVKFITDFFEHVLFKGTNPNATSIDFLYIGDTKNGYFVSKSELYYNVKRDAWSVYENLHVGPVLIRPSARYADKRIASELTRNKVVVYWPKLEKDIKFIQDHFGSNKNPRV